MRLESVEDAMGTFIGLDVSLAAIAVCVVDDSGSILQETKVAADPAPLVAALQPWRGCVVRVGIEAGPLSEWLAAALLEVGLPVVCLETRQVKAALSAMVVKTDRNDAHGIAQITRTGWFKPVHIKTLDSQRSRTLVTARKFLVRALASCEQAIRGLLRPFGLKIGPVTRKGFAPRVQDLVHGEPVLARIMEPLLEARAALLSQTSRLHREVLRAVREDVVCRRLMTMPGIGSVTALTYRATIDDATRFQRSRSLGAYLGLTPRRYQSGEVDRVGRISKTGDGETRTALFEAANVVLRPTTRWSAMKAWAVKVARRQGLKRAKVALARKMAVILHRMWIDGTEFRWGTAAAA